ncbi:hypothetical protein [Streptomyces atratus]|uniref:hypothetical protein n=1 Tax=Streptomyces atratus TaxID=1893 RepID=UPI0022525755|nr:hypothetical protein [Streptomyces atratus]MCX5342148.1 hypothetical protein [Streptomyces atratus]
MGLMSWLRGGGRTETGTEISGEAVAPAAVPRKRVDLSELPPIQRTLGSQDLVIDPSGFQGSLSTRQDTALGTPLGHLVSSDAPTGLVHGIAAPAPVDRPAPLQRSVERVVELPGRGRSVPVSVSAPVSVPVPVQRAESGGAPAMTSAGESAVAELPVRQLVGEQPFVPASTDPVPMPASAPAPVQRAVTPPVAERPRSAPGLGAPMSGLPPTAQRQAAAAVPETETGTETETEAAAGAGVVPVARSMEDSGAGEKPPAIEAPAAPVSREAPEAPQQTPDSDAPTAPLLGDDPLLPAPSESAPAPAPTRPSAPAVQRTPAVPAQAPMSPPPATAPVAPLLADRPLTLYSSNSSESGGTGGAVAVQRSVAGAAGAAGAEGAAGESPSAGAVHASPPDAVPVRWASVGSGAPSVAATASVPAALQRTAPSPGDAPGVLPRPLPALQRQAAGGPPVPRSLPGASSRSAPSAPSAPAAPAAPSFPTAGSVAVAAGVAQRMADGSVVFGSPPPPYSSPVVQRETETTQPPPPEPPQEPEPEPGPMAEDHGAPGEAASAPGAPPGRSGGHGGAAAPVVTDELVRALYTPLSRLFKADLRLERERAGFLINTRH